MTDVLDIRRLERNRFFASDFATTLSVLGLGSVTGIVVMACAVIFFDLSDHSADVLMVILALPWLAALYFIRRRLATARSTESVEVLRPNGTVRYPDGEPIASLWKWMGSTRSTTVIGSLLAALFGWVQLRGIPVPTLTVPPDATYIRHIILAVYYASLVAGTIRDINIQRELYWGDPSLGRLPLAAGATGATVTTAGFFVIGALLLWASNSDERATLALIPVLIVNIIGWKILARRLEPIIAATANDYERAEKFDQLEILRGVGHYIKGSWHWARFSVMAAIVIVANLVAFNYWFRLQLARGINQLIPMISTPYLAVLLPVAGLFLFVVVGEMWIWVYRVRSAIALRTIEALKVRYVLRPRIDSGK